MTPERWRQIEEIFLDAVEISDGAERARFLREKCGTDADLLKEVENLIRQDEDAGTSMLEPLVERSGIFAFADLGESDPAIGSRVVPLVESVPQSITSRSGASNGAGRSST